MNVRITGPQKVSGEVSAPRSKAYTHRALISSLLSHGESTIENPLRSDDTNRTILGLEAMGARVRAETEGVRILGKTSPLVPKGPIDCGESGATFRFLTAIASTGPYKTTLTCKTKRPILPLIISLNELGVSAQVQETDSGLSVRVQGPLEGGSTEIVGDVSSQFISGLLFAAPKAKSAVNIFVEGRIESRPYVEMTMAILKKHGITIVLEGNMFHIPASQEFKSASHRVPGDFSSAAFILAAAATVGDGVAISGLNGSSSLEPDSVIIEFLRKIGVQLETESDRVVASSGGLKSFEFDASDHPDLVPVLEVLACQAEGRSEIRGIKRLVHKESDRLRSIPEELGKLGAKIRIGEDRVLIEGGRELVGAALSSHHDHRVAMASAIASLAAQGTTLIDDAGVVSKSYPEFFRDIEKLGGSFDVE